MFALGEYRTPRWRLPDHLPWACLIDPGTMLQKDGSLMRCWRFRGPDLAVADRSELVALAKRLNTATLRLGSGWACFVEASPREARAYPDARWSTVAARIADLEARSVFERSGLVCSLHYYISLVWMPPSDRVSALDNNHVFFEANHQERGASHELEYFRRVCTETAGMLGSVLPEFVALEGDELATYLHSCVSLQEQRVVMPEVPVHLDAYLPDEAWTPGDVSMLGEHCLSMFEIRAFPARTPIGMLEALNHVGPHRWVTRFIFLDRDEAEQRIAARQQLWFFSRKSFGKLAKEAATRSESPLFDPIADDRAKDAEDALRELGAGEIGFGYFTSTLVFWDKDPDIARRKAQEAKKIVQNSGLIAIDATVNGLEAWLATIPGHLHANVRRTPISTQNLVRLMPTLSVWSGQPRSAHLEKVCGVGTPLIRCVSGSTPFDLSFDVGGVMHAFVAGPPGSGKSTLASTMALYWTRYPGAKVIIYDIERSSRATTMAVGGMFYELGDPSGKAALQPLRRVDDPSERLWAAQWVRTLLELQHVTYTHEVQLAVDQALERLAAEPNPAARTMSHFASCLGTFGKALSGALRPYTLDGQYGHVFDGDVDRLDVDTPWRVYELRRLLRPGEPVDSALVTPVLMYLSHSDRRAFDGRPVLKIIDEAWRFMDHPLAVEQMRAEAKLLRRHNVCLAFFTQEIADAASKPELLSTVHSACKTELYLPDPSATKPNVAALYASVGLTPREIATLASATPQRDIFYRSPLGRRWFSLPLGPAALAFVGGASSDADHLELDEIERQCRPQEYAAALLERRGVTWAAEMARGNP